MKNIACLGFISLCAFLNLASAVASLAEAVKWDYLKHPVKVTENHPETMAVFGMEVARAFDGYGAQGSKPTTAGCWQQPQPGVVIDGKVVKATPPYACEID